MSVKKTLLRKVINNTLQDIYPKTDASIVVYTKTSGSGANATTTTTNVAEELASLASAIAALQSDVTAINTPSKIYLEVNDVIQTDSDGTGLVPIY